VAASSVIIPPKTPSPPRPVTNMRRLRTRHFAAVVLALLFSRPPGADAASCALVVDQKGRRCGRRAGRRMPAPGCHGAGVTDARAPSSAGPHLHPLPHRRPRGPWPERRPRNAVSSIVSCWSRARRARSLGGIITEDAATASSPGSIRRDEGEREGGLTAVRVGPDAPSERLRPVGGGAGLRGRSALQGRADALGEIEVGLQGAGALAEGTRNRPAISRRSMTPAR